MIPGTVTQCETLPLNQVSAKKLKTFKTQTFKLCLPRIIFCCNDSVGCGNGDGTTGTGGSISPEFNGFEEERFWIGFKIFDFLFRFLLRCFGTGWFVFGFV